MAEDRKCPTCGASMQGKKLRAKFCSRKCAGRYRDPNSLATCQFCFDVFLQTKKTDRFCCGLCREEYLAGKRRLRAMTPSELVRRCKNCDLPFIVIDLRDLFCSKDCGADFYSRTRREEGRSAAASKRWRLKNQDAYHRSKHRIGKASYAKMKSDVDRYNSWRAKMAEYVCPDKKRASQRRRSAEKAIALLIMPLEPQNGDSQ